MKSLIPVAALPALVCLLAAPHARAQEKPADPPPANTAVTGPSGALEYSPSCGWFKKVVHPTVENEPHKCIRYDVEEEDYCFTKCVHTPILSIFCRDGHCGKAGCDHDDADKCPKCGHPHTRKVLIKEFVTEEIPTAKCHVERVAQPCKPACVPDGPKCTSLTGEQAAPQPAPGGSKCVSLSGELIAPPAGAARAKPE